MGKAETLREPESLRRDYSHRAENRKRYVSQLVSRLKDESFALMKEFKLMWVGIFITKKRCLATAVLLCTFFCI